MVLDNRLFFPATERNRECIGDLLSKIPLKGSILEIGSGSGQHAVNFQKRFPKISWQSSDPMLIHRNSIIDWIHYEGLNLKMPPPIDINVEKIPWVLPSMLKQSLELIISINMIHVACWNCTKCLFRESGKLLKNGQFLFLYGPFKINNQHISESNNLFDKSLKMKNKFWGLRDLEEVSEEGRRNNFIQDKLIKMPANNFSIIYRKDSPS